MSDIAKARTDAERIDWLDENYEDLERLFGMCVRDDGSRSLRDMIDELIGRSSRICWWVGTRRRPACLRIGVRSGDSLVRPTLFAIGSER